jgi:hypothetical protein
VYINAEFLNAAYGTGQVTALCGTTEELTATIELAEAEVESALTMGGYSGAVPSSVYTAIGDVPKVVKLAAYGAWLELAHGRNSLEIPKEFQPYTRKIEDIRLGRLEIPGVPKVVGRAVGGVLTTETDDSIEGGKPQIFSRDALEGY